MAGKLKMPTMESPLFSLNPVDRKTLANWRARIDMEQLVPQLRWILRTRSPLEIHYQEGRQLGNLVETLQEVQGQELAFPIRATSSMRLWLNDTDSTDVFNATVMTVAGGKSTDGLDYLLIANTYRAMHQELTGPIPGFNFNITVAGIVAMCMRLDIPVEMDS